MHNTLIFAGILSLTIMGCDPGSELAPSFQIDTPPATAEVFAPGVISTSMSERDLAISPDGIMILFSVSTPDQSIRAIAGAQFVDNKWSAPEVVTFSGVHDDIEPAFSPDGNTLFFASNRPLDPMDSIPDYNIWQVSLSDGSWSEPRALDTVINTDGNEYYPSVSANGTLYFTASRSDTKGQEDIYVSRFSQGAYTQPESLDTAVNSAFFEFNAFIAPDESYLIFGSFGRSDGHGGGDLYISTRSSDGAWTTARNLGPGINSPKLDYCPFVHIQNEAFYFTSDRGAAAASDSTFSYQDIVEISSSVINGMGNIYHVNQEALGLQ